MNASSLTSCAARSRPAGPLLVAAITLVVGVAWAQTRIDPNGVNVSGSVIGDDVLYSIGGGRASRWVVPATCRDIGVGVGWNSNLICGDMSITTTLQNQLNGITNGFQTIMKQRDPERHQRRGLAAGPDHPARRPGACTTCSPTASCKARLDFDRSKMTCRAIANRMADMAGGQAGWDQLAEGMALRDAVSSTDAVSAIEQAESNKGNNGVPWVGGGNAGGSGQSSIKVVGDVTRAGYNLLNGRSATDTSSIARSACGNRLTCQTWSSPEAAADWATRVLGEREQRTCENCTKDQTTPGVGLTPVIQEEYETKLQVLQELVTGARPTTPVISTRPAAIRCRSPAA